MKTLDYCPFCGERRAHVKHSRMWGYFVACDCTAVGPGRATVAEAVDAWNERPEPKQGRLAL